MYIVRDKKTRQIIHKNPAPLVQQLEGKEVYFEFDAKTMEIGKTEQPTIPNDFEIDQNGLIILPEEPVTSEDNDQSPDQKTLADRVKEGLIELSPSQKIVGEGRDQAIVEKTLEEQYREGLITINEPFEYVEQGELKQRTLEEVISGNLLKTVDQCIKALKMLKSNIDQAISLEFSPGAEMKITKKYLEWLKDGQPENDSREREYNEMQQRIETIKNELKPLKEQILNIQKELEKKIK